MAGTYYPYAKGASPVCDRVSLRIPRNRSVRVSELVWLNLMLKLPKTRVRVLNEALVHVERILKKEEPLLEGKGLEEKASKSLYLLITKEDSSVSPHLYIRLREFIKREKNR